MYLSSASVAMVSPGRTTRPTETGTLSTRPAAGASTAPSVACCAITSRSPFMAVEVALGDVEDWSWPDRACVCVDDAAPCEFGDAVEIGLGLIALRLQRGDARIERLHLQARAWRRRPARRRRRPSTSSPSLIDSAAIVPPMRARATSWWTGSTVAMTALRSAISVSRTTRGSAERRGGGEEKEEREASHQIRVSPVSA